MDSVTKTLTISQILGFYEDIIYKPENRDAADTIYLDFSKVSDKVDHNILLHKIKAINITGKILKWLETFLKIRQQRPKSKTVIYQTGCGCYWVLLGSFADNTRI